LFYDAFRLWVSIAEIVGIVTSPATRQPLRLAVSTQGTN